MNIQDLLTQTNTLPAPVKRLSVLDGEAVIRERNALAQMMKDDKTGEATRQYTRDFVAKRDESLAEMRAMIEQVKSRPLTAEEWAQLSTGYDEVLAAISEGLPECWAAVQATPIEQLLVK